jgi:hypothetical protein
MIIMKLSTLLLSSAAVLVAGAAFAADLPAKKAAPAAATGCPAFGAGYFAIPGGDTCIKFSGYMNYMGSYTSAGAFAQSADSRLRVDAKSNSDLGVVGGVLRWNLTSTKSSISAGRAYATLGGLSAGKYGALADLQGTSAWNYTTLAGGGGMNGTGSSGIGVKYDMAVGTGTLTLAVENATIDTANNKRPDVLAKYSMPAGPVTATILVASHEASLASYTSGAGYAALGNVRAKMDSFGVAAWAGTSTGAIMYTGNAGGTVTADYDGTNMSTGSVFGGEVTYAVGAGTFAVVGETATAKLSANSDTISQIGAYYSYPVAKNFSVEPEFIQTTLNSVSSNTFYLQIRRDF